MTVVKDGEPCVSTDRSHDPISPKYPGNQNHAALHVAVACRGCGIRGIARSNGRGVSPPHGWWFGKYSVDWLGMPSKTVMYCSSECIAHVER